MRQALILILGSPATTKNKKATGIHAGLSRNLVSSDVAVLEEVVLLLFNGIAVRSSLAARSLDHNRFLLPQMIVLVLQGGHLRLQLRNLFLQANNSGLSSEAPVSSCMTRVSRFF